jgi:hypothetical protein
MFVQATCSASWGHLTCLMALSMFMAAAHSANGPSCRLGTEQSQSTERDCMFMTTHELPSPYRRILASS